MRRPPRIEHAEGAIDLPHLLTLVPASLVPVEAERARLRYRVRHLVLLAVPRLEDDGSASIEGELGRVRVLGAGGLVADGGKLDVTARPEGGLTRVHATVPLAALVQGGIGAERLLATVDARIARDSAVTGDVGVRFGACAWPARPGSPRATASSARTSRAARRPGRAARHARPRHRERAGSPLTPRRRACMPSPTGWAPPCARTSPASRPTQSTPSCRWRACA